MESTGVYWIPVYEILEQRGFEVILVNARYAQNVPGRKTDVSDAAWLRQLHSYGLLGGSFRPDADLMPRLQPCAPICGSENGWWNMPPPISSICKRP
jgi:Transposase